MLKIINFESQYQPRVKEISYEWLMKYNLWEPIDDEYLDNPKEMILDKGGYLFLAEFGGEIVGTVALVPVEEGVAEISKLGVTEKMQGMKIGKQLMEKCIETAEQKGLKKLILYSNQLLTNSIDMYKKFGFVEIIDDTGKYDRADIKMELLIGAGEEYE